MTDPIPIPMPGPSGDGSQAGNTNQTRNATSISAIDSRLFKPPPFWKKDPELWFGQIESLFYRSNITSDTTKFHCIVSSIESDVLATVGDLVKKPPAADKYQTIKKRLIAHFADTEQQRLRKLLSDLDLGDKKPSFLLQEMRQLSDSASAFPDDALKSLWLQRLPLSIQSILAVNNKEALDSLAQLADRIAEVNSSTSSVISAIQSSPSPDFCKLENQIAQLTKRIEELQNSQPKRSRSRFRSRPRTPASSPSSKTNKTGGNCWYHQKFGEKAQKCVPPCTFTAEN